MRKCNQLTGLLALAITAIMLTIIGCTTVDDSKMTITTSSEKARNYFLQGRELTEKLRGQESLEFFEKAVAEDSKFALGYLNLALNYHNFKGFFENLDKAKALVDNVTEGERLWILGIEAGVNADPMMQRELYQKLAALYPDDERVHVMLATNYFGQQEYALAIEEYNKAKMINPEYSPLYNMLGYSYRFMENYNEAEMAFEKYIELIPDDPNPHDSYAELLLKLGRYDESIKSYQKALELKTTFIASHIGIATNLNYKGENEKAREQLQKMYDGALNDGQRRAARFAMAVSYVDERKFDKALEELNKQYELAKKINDVSAMAGDLNAMGNILYESSKYNKALVKHEMARKMMQESGLSKGVIDNAKRFYLFNSSRVACMKKDFTTAKTNADEYHKQVVAINNPFQIKFSHQLYAIIALAEKDYDKALAELNQANQQNPYNLYRMALAYKAKGDNENAKEWSGKAANFNALNGLNYSFIRHKAKKMNEAL